MISHPDRVKAVELIDAAVAAGARRHRACATLGINDRTYRRWCNSETVRADARPTAVRPVPMHKLSDAERQAMLEVCHEPEFASRPPGQIVPVLADHGQYLASESSFYRVLRDADEQHHRGRAGAPRRRRAPNTHRTSAPREL